MITLQFDDKNFDIKDSDNLPLAMTFQTSDIEDITKRKGNYTKTFELAATKQNLSNIKNLFDPLIQQDSADVIALKSRKNAAILSDGIPIRTGYARISAVFVDREPSKIVCIFFSGNTNWIDRLSELTLRDLDLGTSVVTKTHVQATQISTTSIHQFGLVNYGEFSEADGVRTLDFRPMYYIEKIFEAIFNGIGFNVVSNFLDHADIKRDLLYCSGEPLALIPDENKDATEIGITGSQAIYTSEAWGTFPVVPFLPFSFWDDIVTDDATNPRWNLATKVFTCYNAGSYNFVLDITMLTSGFSYSGTQSWEMRLVVVDSGGSVKSNSLFGTLSWNSNGSDSLVSELVTVSLEQDDEVRLAYVSSPSTPNATGTGSLSVTALTLTSAIDKYDVQRRALRINDTYELEELLNDWTQLKWVRQMQLLFNLHIDVDEANVYIEPEHDWIDTSSVVQQGFYKPKSEAVDWTFKQDHSKEVEHFFPDSYKKFIQYQYQLDDAYMQGIEKAFSKRYAEYEQNLGDRFQQGITEYKTDIAKSWHGWFLDNCLMPLIKDEFTDNDISQTESHQPRVFVYKRTNETDKDGNTASFKYYDDDAGTSTTETFIPKLFMVNYDNITDFQLTFDSIGSGIGLIERFFIRSIQELQYDIVIKSYFNLNMTDIIALDMRKPVYLAGQYYKINKIKDYQPNKDNVTKVELLTYVERPTIEIPDTPVILKDGTISGKHSYAKTNHAHSPIPTLIAMGNETENMTTGVKITMIWPANETIDINADLGGITRHATDGGSAGTTTIDIHKNGVSMFSTKPTYTSGGSSNIPDWADVVLETGDEIEFIVDSVATAQKGLKVILFTIPEITAVVTNKADYARLQHAHIQWIAIALSGETDIISEGTVFSMIFPSGNGDFVIQDVILSLVTASSSGDVELDIDRGVFGGGSIFHNGDTLVNIAESETESITGSDHDYEFDDDVQIIPAGSFMGFIIPSGKAGTNAAGLKVYLIGYYTESVLLQ